MSYPKTEILLRKIHEWSLPLIEHEAFRQLARAKIRSALDWEEDWPAKEVQVREIILPEPLATQHEAIMQFYNLWSTSERLRTVEFYFRRYPFNGLPINQHEHLENVCLMFFGYFYVIHERLRVFLNALNAAAAPAALDVGKTLKLYQRRFSAELRQRHNGTHLEPLDDPTIQAVMLRRLRDDDGDLRAKTMKTYAYRKASREWAAHARRGSEQVAAFVEAVASASLEIATFLDKPPTPAPDDLKVR